MTMILQGAEELTSAVGTELGVSEWLTVDQSIIDDFARTTRDEQWIHVDRERAASGPFGTTIAHGFLILSLIPHFSTQILEVRGFSTRINYGLEKVRFPQPLLSGERVRDRLSVMRVEQVPTGTRAIFSHRIESAGGDRPVCVAETVTLFVP